MLSPNIAPANRDNGDQTMTRCGQNLDQPVTNTMLKKNRKANIAPISTLRCSVRRRSVASSMAPPRNTREKSGNRCWAGVAAGCGAGSCGGNASRSVAASVGSRRPLRRKASMRCWGSAE
jgi:hypothetical protein